MVKPDLAGVKLALKKVSSRLVVAVLIIAAIAFLAIFVLQSLRIREAQAQYEQKKSELAQYQERNTKLKQQLEFLQGPGYMLYVESVARQALGMAKPGETVILPVPTDASAAPPAPGSLPAAPVVAKEPEKKPGWRNWLDFLFN